MRLINSDSQVTDARVIARDGGAAATGGNVRLDMGPIVLVGMAALLLVIGACGVVMGIHIGRYDALTEQSARTEKEARMLEYYVNEVDGKLIHAGFIEPRDRWSPEKRKQYEEKHP